MCLYHSLCGRCHYRIKVKLWAALWVLAPLKAIFYQIAVVLPQMEELWKWSEYFCQSRHDMRNRERSKREQGCQKYTWANKHSQVWRCWDNIAVSGQSMSPPMVITRRTSCIIQWGQSHARWGTWARKKVDQSPCVIIDWEF